MDAFIDFGWTVIAWFFLIGLLWFISRLIYDMTKNILKTIYESKYAYSFLKWWLTVKKGQTISKSLEKRFLTMQDYAMVFRMQCFINTLSTEHLNIKKMKYIDLKHPIFMWHDRLFCRSNGREVICLEDGRVGVINENEIVKSVIIFDSLVQISEAIDLQMKMVKKFDEMGWDDFDFKVEALEKPYRGWN